MLCLLVFWMASSRVAGQDREANLAYGGLIGRVFLDRDGDGAWSDGDEGLRGARLLTDTGLEVVTGPGGAFHMFLLGTGHEVAGSHVIVLDRSSLPADVEVVGSPRRLIDLVPHETARLDFAVRLPRLQASGPPSARPAPGREPPLLEVSADGRVVTRLAGVVPAGCAVAVDGRPAPLDEKGHYEALVAVEPGVNPHLVSMHCADGHLELTLVEIHWVKRSAGGDLVVPTRPRTLAVCSGPPAGLIPLATRADLVCWPEPGVSLEVDGPASNQEQGRLGFVLPVGPGDNRFPIRIQYQRQSVSGQVGWEVERIHWVGTLLGSLSMAYGYGGGADGLYFGGKLGGLVQATLPWDLKLILAGGLDAFETKGLSASEVAREGLGPHHDPQRFERDPDPERAPLISGDGAEVIARNPADSRYLLQIQRKGSFLGWGGFRTCDGPDNGPGRFHRSLVGAHAGLRPFEDLFPGDDPPLDLRLEGFYARPDDIGDGLQQLPAREEFLSTGGTMYFLGHGWVVEGSENLVVERRDARTGLSLSQRKLRRGIDYQVDWLSGRVLLTEPLDPGLLAEGAVRLVPLGAAATVLKVEYEYLAEAVTDPHDSVTGGQVTLSGRPLDDLHLSGSFGGFFALGGEADEYSLFRTRAQVRYGDRATVWATWADSQGRLLEPSYSVDGGLSLISPPEPGSKAGEAYEAGATVNAGPFEGRLMFRRFLYGFSDTGWLASSDLTQFFGQARVDLIDGLDMHGRFSGTEIMSGQLYEGLFGLRWRIVQPLVLSLEGAYDGAFENKIEKTFGDGQRALVGLRIGWQALDRLALVAGHQHGVWAEGMGRAGRDLTLTTGGGQVRLFDDLQASLEGGWGPQVGTLVRLGLAQDRGQGGAVFAHTTFSVDRAALRAGSLTTGQMARTDRGWTVSSSQTLTRDTGGMGAGQRVGLEVPIGKPWRLKVAYERAELHAAGDRVERNELFPGPFFDRGAVLSGPGRRNAVFGRLAFLGRSFLVSASGEYRMDEHLPLASDPDLTSHRQTVLRLAARWRPLPGLTLGGRVAWAETFGAVPDATGPGLPQGGFLEASVGAAYRPAGIDWLRLVFRASVDTDRRPDHESEYGPEIWYSGTLAAMFNPTRFFQPTLVVAPWLRELPSSADRESPARAGLMGMLRIGSQVYAGLGLAGEVRLASEHRLHETIPPQEPGGLDVGLAAEAFYQLEDEDLGGLRLSVGYSFSDLPDPLLMSDLHAGRQGVFVRLEGML